MKISTKSLVLGLLVAVFANAGEVSIAAAANTTYAFDEIKAEFAKECGFKFSLLEYAEKETIELIKTK